MSIFSPPHAWAVAGAIGLLAGLAQPAFAVTTTLDLRSGDSGTINGGTFSTLAEDIDDTPSEGTGVFQPFLRVHTTGNGDIEQGYNTDRKKSDFQFDEIAGVWTHSVQLQDLLVDSDGNIRLLLDIQEPTPANKVDISLDMMEIYVGNAADPGDYPFASLTPVYDLGDSQVLLRSSLYGSGQGRFDMEFTIAASIFAGFGPDDYFILYTKFGNEYAAEGAFEEWSAVQGEFTQIPVPAALPLLLTSMLGLGFLSRRRKTV